MGVRDGYGLGQLNREMRRALERSVKSTKLEIKNGVDGIVIDELKSDTKAFDLNGLDILPFAVYMICSSKEIYKEYGELLEKLFYKNIDISEIYKVKDSNIKVLADKMSLLVKLGKCSYNLDKYLLLYTMCRLDKEVASKCSLSAFGSVGLKYMLSLIEAYNKKLKISNKYIKENSNNLYSSKKESDEIRLILLIILLGFKWGSIKLLFDTSLIENKLGFNGIVTKGLEELVANYIPSSEEYIKWVKGELSFVEAMDKSGDSIKLSTLDLANVRNFNKTVRALLVYNADMCLYSKELKKRVEVLGGEVTGLNGKLQSIKKEKQVEHSELKATKRELSDLNRKLASSTKQLEESIGREKELIAEVANYKGKIDEYKNKIESYEVKIKELNSNKEENNNSSSGLAKGYEDLKLDMSILAAKYNKLLNSYEDMLGYIEDSENKSSIDCSIPLELVVNKIKGYRYIICGGRGELADRLTKLGFSGVKQYDVGKVPVYNDGVQYDCLIILTKCVVHKSIMGIRQNAKQLNKDVIYFNGSNVEGLIREIYRVMVEEC